MLRHGETKSSRHIAVWLFIVGVVHVVLVVFQFLLPLLIVLHVVVAIGIDYGGSQSLPAFLKCIAYVLKEEEAEDDVLVLGGACTVSSLVFLKVLFRNHSSTSLARYETRPCRPPYLMYGGPLVRTQPDPERLRSEAKHFCQLSGVEIPFVLHPLTST